MVIACACAFLPSRASAQTNNTCYVNYGFYGPAGHYKIELFETGHPYPSRQDFTLWSNNYSGQRTYWSTWSYISINASYFIRVTNDKGVAKQTIEFSIRGQWDYYNAPECDWYTM